MTAFQDFTSSLKHFLENHGHHAPQDCLYFYPSRDSRSRTLCPKCSLLCCHPDDMPPSLLNGLRTAVAVIQLRSAERLRDTFVKTGRVNSMFTEEEVAALDLNDPIDDVMEDSQSMKSYRRRLLESVPQREVDPGAVVSLPDPDFTEDASGTLRPSSLLVSEGIASSGDGSSLEETMDRVIKVTEKYFDVIRGAKASPAAASARDDNVRFYVAAWADRLLSDDRARDAVIGTLAGRILDDLRRSVPAHVRAEYSRPDRLTREECTAASGVIAAFVKNHSLSVPHYLLWSFQPTTNRPYSHGTGLARDAKKNPWITGEFVTDDPTLAAYGDGPSTRSRLVYDKGEFIGYNDGKHEDDCLPLAAAAVSDGDTRNDATDKVVVVTTPGASAPRIMPRAGDSRLVHTPNMIPAEPPADAARVGSGIYFPDDSVKAMEKCDCAECPNGCSACQNPTETCRNPYCANKG